MSFLKNFVDFVREHGVVGLAVGLAIGFQSSNAVSSIVSGFVDPFVGLLLGGTDLTGISSTVSRGDNSYVFEWGLILQALLTLVATAFVIFFLVEKLGLTKIDKKK